MSYVQKLHNSFLVTKKKPNTKQIIQLSSVCSKLFQNPGVYAQNDTWSSWLDCDKPCGGGIQRRYRDQCPADEKTCVVIEGQKCNEFDCSLTSSKFYIYLCFN